MELYYIQINIFCIILLGMIAMLIMENYRYISTGRRIFSWLFVNTIFLCVSDIFAWCFNGKEGPGAGLAVLYSNAVYYITITAAGFIWLRYVNLKLGGLENHSRRYAMISAIPLAGIILVTVTTAYTGFFFTVGDDNVYHRGAGVPLHWIISWGYLIYAEILVVRKIIKTDSAVKKRELLPLACFIIPPAVSAVIQMVFYGVTSMQCGMTLSVVLISCTSLIEKVSRDSLTELNNRNAFENYLSERIRLFDRQFVLMMCDVDRFKTINDTLGHVTGDMVLKRMAGVLKQACAESRYPLFLCRYGGDEFVICGTGIDMDETERLKSSIAEKLDKLNRDYPSEISFSMSIGSAGGICAEPGDIEALIKKADEQMYEEKNRTMNTAAQTGKGLLSHR